MLRDITLGKYYPADSPIHKLRPACQIIRHTDLYYIAVLFSRFGGVWHHNDIFDRSHPAF